MVETDEQAQLSGQHDFRIEMRTNFPRDLCKFLVHIVS